MKVDEIRNLARDSIKDLFEITIDNIIEKTFNLEDNDCPDEYLISVHLAFREMLKKMTGTGRRVEGFSELWYFLYIKKYLEKFLKKEFEVKETRTGDLVHYHFELPYNKNMLILCSDLSVEVNFQLKIHSKRSTRPGIFIGLKTSNENVIPIAIFEIKLYQRLHQIKGVVNRFIEMKDTLTSDNINLPFFIFLYLQHSEYRFKKELQDEFNIQIDKFKDIS